MFKNEYLIPYGRLGAEVDCTCRRLFLLRRDPYQYSDRHRFSAQASPLAEEESPCHIFAESMQSRLYFVFTSEVSPLSSRLSKSGTSQLLPIFFLLLLRCLFDFCLRLPQPPSQSGRAERESLECAYQRLSVLTPPLLRCSNLYLPVTGSMSNTLYCMNVNGGPQLEGEQGEGARACGQAEKQGG